MQTTSFLTNILSFGRLRRLGWKIEYTYDEDMFIISYLDESFTVEFHSNKDCLYVAKPGPKYLKFIEMKNKQNFVNTCRANDYNRYDCRIGRIGIRSSGSDGHFHFIILIKYRTIQIG